MAATVARTDPASRTHGVCAPRRAERDIGSSPAHFFFGTERAGAETDTDVTRRCNRALELMLAHRGDPAAEIDGILADHPRSLFGHALRAALIVRNDDRAAGPSLAASIAAIEEAGLAPDHPARRHAAAASSWLKGQSAIALERYGAIAAVEPSDSLAIAAAHALDFRLGERRMLRDRIARVIDAWHPAMPGYPAILAMYAFGLEENGELRQAERLAERALAIDPNHPPAIHVLAHVMEMEGRGREGLGFLARHEAARAEGTDLSVHLAWHRALFHLQIDEPSAALEVYDRQIATATGSGLSALADASALLWRLKLRDIALGARWRALANQWEKAPLRGARPFYLVHAIMAFAASGRRTAVTQLLRAVPSPNASASARFLPEDVLVHPVANALLAFAAGDYHTSAGWLERVREIASRCGGSLAQCELVQLTFAAARSRAEQAQAEKPGAASTAGFAITRDAFGAL